VIDSQGHAINCGDACIEGFCSIVLCFSFLGLVLHFFFLLVCSPLLSSFCFVLFCFLFVASIFHILTLSCGILVESKFSTTFLCCFYYYVVMLCMVVVVIVLLFCRVVMKINDVFFFLVANFCYFEEIFNKIWKHVFKCKMCFSKKIWHFFEICNLKIKTTWVPCF